ncbi:hypothetical protein ACWEGE_17000 [Amycolatopsis sp. NPDC004747]
MVHDPDGRQARRSRRPHQGKEVVAVIEFLESEQQMKFCNKTSNKT